MPKFYCEYCGIYLTHSSPSGRKQHAHGRKHIQNKIDQNINQQKMSNNPLMMRNALSLHQNPLLNYANRNIGLSGLGIPQIGGMPGMNANPTPMVSGYSFITNQMTQMPAEP